MTAVAAGGRVSSGRAVAGPMVPPGAGAPVSAAVSAAALGAELDGLARLGDPARRRLVSVAVAVRPIDPIALVGRALEARRPVAFWCQPLDEQIVVGVGAATTIPLAGPEAFEAAEAAWRALADGALVGGPAAVAPGAGPRLLGGAAFARPRGSGRGPIWEGFGEGWLRLPELLVVASADEAVVTASVVLEPGVDPAGETAAVAALAERLLSADTLSVDGVGVGEGRPVASVDPVPDGAGDDGHRASGSGLPALRLVARWPDRRSWEAAVARAAGAVGRGRLDKVVLARRVDLAADGPIEVEPVLRRLVAAAPGSTIFALSTGAVAPDGTQAVFLGATPERLVEVRGRSFRTVALAGTVGRGRDPVEDDALAAELLASEKDREEHAVVVDMLRATLAPLAETLAIESTPHVVRLATVQHLATEVAGRLRADGGILGLVGRLHPTPAVGGWPREAALAYIDEEEGLDRGWYAGPVGWLDARGDGEFVVGIRSGVVRGSAVSLFAGCGIVADSEPEREWEESELKLRALAAGLGRVVEDGSSGGVR